MITSAPAKYKGKKPAGAKKPGRTRKRQAKKQVLAKADKSGPVKADGPRGPPTPPGVDLRKLPQLPFAKADKPSGQTNIIAVEMNLDASSVIGVAVGIVSRLVDIGYGVGLIVGDPQSSLAYWLTQFLVDQMLLAARGLKLSVERVPYGILCLFDALRPTTMYYKTASISYTWTDISTGPIAVGNIINYGPLQMNLGTIGPPTGSTQGYSSIVPPTAYTLDSGVSAWNHMLELLGTDTTGTQVLKLMDASQDTIFKKDASAFATIYSQISSGSIAAYTSQLFLPNKIRYPVFSQFVSYNDDTLVSSESHIFAGSPRWLGGRLLTLSEIKYAKNKARPIYQPVDFNDLYDILANIMGRAAELATESNVSAFTVPTCPLTSQQVALMLRGLVASFSNKAMPSDLALTDDNFMPLQFPYACANVSAIAKTCSLPFYFVENLRSLCTVSANLQGPKAVDQQLIFMPVFGVYGEPRTDYNYTYSGINNVNVYLYANSTVTVDMVSLLTNTSDYAAITGVQLANAISVWNAWITQFSAVCPLATFSTTTNNPALYSLLYQRGFAFNLVINSNIEDKLVKAYKTQSREIKAPLFEYASLLKVVRNVNPTTVTNQCEKYIASNMSMNESVYELMSNWVLPKVFIADNTAKQKYVGNFIMPYVVATSSSYGLTLDQTTYPTLDSKWRAAAIVATKQPTAAMSELLQVLWKNSEEGHGGFLGEILGEFASQITGIPLFSTLGRLVPF